MEIAQQPCPNCEGPGEIHQGHWPWVKCTRCGFMASLTAWDHQPWSLIAEKIGDCGSENPTPQPLKPLL
jgi:hypothetical protein